MAKRTFVKQKIAKFVPRKDMFGDGGWKISSDGAKRYNLMNGDDFHYSHVSRDVCIKIAQDRFGVKMKEKKSA